MVLTVQLAIVDIPVHPRTSQDVVDCVLGPRPEGDGRPMVIGNLNLHGLYLYLSDGTFREYCQRANLVIIDGWPIWFLARLRSRRLPVTTRIGSTDWLFALLESSRPVTITSISGTPRSARRAHDVVRERHPSVTWLPFDGFEFQWQGTGNQQTSLENAIRRADLVIVGLGMPRQEAWILQHSDLLAGKCVANVGGCVDYLAGEQLLAPRWMGRVGLEWLFRLLADPRRLAARYLVEPVKLLAVLALRPDLRS